MPTSAPTEFYRAASHLLSAAELADILAEKRQHPVLALQTRLHLGRIALAQLTRGKIGVDDGFLSRQQPPVD